MEIKDRLINVTGSSDDDDHNSQDQTRGGAQADSPAEIPPRGWADIGKRTLKKISDDNVPMMAGAVAFAGFLSLFPALIAALSIYSLVTDPATALQQAASLTSSLPAGAADVLTGQMKSVAEAGNGAAGFGLVFSILAALWGASGGMSMLVKGVNLAYDNPDDRSFFKTRGLAIALAIGAIVFFGAAITLVAVLPTVLGQLGAADSFLSAAGRWLLLAGLLIAALAILYRVAPAHDDVEWQWLSPGAVLATFLWLAATAGFAFFVNNFGSYNQTYGALAGVAVLLLWLQISSMIVLLGAEFNAEAERQPDHDPTD